MSTINDRIIELRKFMHMSQVEFASKLGITNAHVSKIEKGKTVPSESLIKLICKEYDVNEDWLKNGTGKMNKELYFDEIHGNIIEANDIINNLFLNDSLEIKNLASAVYLTYSKLITINSNDDKVTSEYLELILSFMVSINSYCTLLKQMSADGVLKADSKNADFLYNNFSGQINDNLIQIKKFFLEKIKND